jgi:hypothetical protein
MCDPQTLLNLIDQNKWWILGGFELVFESDAVTGVNGDGGVERLEPGRSSQILGHVRQLTDFASAGCVSTTSVVRVSARRRS